jgi:hypothetical protein
VQAFIREIDSQLKVSSAGTMGQANDPIKIGIGFGAPVKTGER